jgi:hypothetical protein
MKYAIFAGLNYYPSGGWGDMVAVTEDLDKAEEKYLLYLSKVVDETDYEYDWVQLVDISVNEILKEN